MADCVVEVLVFCMDWDLEVGDWLAVHAEGVKDVRVGLFVQVVLVDCWDFVVEYDRDVVAE